MRIKIIFIRIKQSVAEPSHLLVPDRGLTHMNEDTVGLVGEAAPDLPVRQEFPERMLDLLSLGGPVALILTAMSLVALTIILAKAWQFHAVRIGSFRVAHEALGIYRSGDSREALAVTGGSPNPAAAALARAIRGRRSALPEAAVREEVMRYGAHTLESLSTGLRALEIIASLAPLLGLFGTVLGMIEAFREMEQAGHQVNPAVLSGGIWEALLTTALGLGVAIPVVVALGWLERRVDRLAHEMGHVVTGIFTVDLSGETEKEDRVEHPSLRLGSAAAGD